MFPKNITIAEKVAYLSQPDVYPEKADFFTIQETHMCWVFMIGRLIVRNEASDATGVLSFGNILKND